MSFFSVHTSALLDGSHFEICLEQLTNLNFLSIERKFTTYIYINMAFKQCIYNCITTLVGEVLNFECIHENFIEEDLNSLQLLANCNICSSLGFRHRTFLKPLFRSRFFPAFVSGAEESP